MTERSYPQQGIAVGDATLAPYSADVFGLHFTGNTLGFPRRANYGVVRGYDNGINYSLEVTPTSPATKNIEVKAGAGMVRGMGYETDATVTLPIADNAAGNPRIDTIVLRRNYVAQTIRLAVLQGTAAASPVAPTLTQTDGLTWEVPIADIRVANGFSSIIAANILPRQQTVNTGDGVYVDAVLNNSGATLEQGDIVIWDTTTARAVATTTVVNHPNVAGVWDSRSTANGSYGRLLIRGFAKIRMRAINPNANALSILVGAIVITGATAKRATIVDFRQTVGPVMAPLVGTEAATGVGTGGGPAQIGRVMESISVSAATTYDDYALVYVDVQQQRNPFMIFAYSLTTGTFTNGAWRTRALSTIYSSVAERQTIANTPPYVTLSGNVLTFEPGFYHVRAGANGYRVDEHQIRLRNTTVGIDFGTGTLAYSPSAADSSQTLSVLETTLAVVTSNMAYELQHQCTTTKATDGFGRATPVWSGGAINAFVTIARLGDVA